MKSKMSMIPVMSHWQLTQKNTLSFLNHIQQIKNTKV